MAHPLPFFKFAEAITTKYAAFFLGKGRVILLHLRGGVCIRPRFRERLAASIAGERITDHTMTTITEASNA
jgi:hypothetical protein